MMQLDCGTKGGDVSQARQTRITCSLSAEGYEDFADAMKQQWRLISRHFPENLSSWKPDPVPLHVT
jgi:hypothetical protein